MHQILPPVTNYNNKASYNRIRKVIKIEPWGLKRHLLTLGSKPTIPLDNPLPIKPYLTLKLIKP